MSRFSTHDLLHVLTTYKSLHHFDNHMDCGTNTRLNKRIQRMASLTWK